MDDRRDLKAEAGEGQEARPLGSSVCSRRGPHFRWNLTMTHNTRPGLTAIGMEACSKGCSGPSPPAAAASSFAPISSASAMTFWIVSTSF